MSIQLVMAVATVLSFALGALAFLFVIWPSIRNAERRGARIEAWLESEDAKDLLSAAKSKLLGFGTSEKPSSREGFLQEAVPDVREGGTVKL